MPTLSQISNNFFVNLITRLGVRPPPPEAFLLSNVVQPVSIVDTDVALTAQGTSQLLDTPFTAGEQLVPAANTILADTGQQNAGNYLLLLLLEAIDGTNSPFLSLERRNAANAANIWNQTFYSPNGSVGGHLSIQLPIRVTLQANERVRCQNLNVGAAGSRYHVNIWLLPS